MVAYCQDHRATGGLEREIQWLSSEIEPSPSRTLSSTGEIDTFGLVTTKEK